MRYALPYDTQQWLNSFSARLQHLALPRYQAAVDQSVKADNLRYNLVRLLAQLINTLTFADHSPAVVKAALQQFNQAHRSTLTFQELAALGWVRVINGEVVLPGAVTNLIRHLTRVAALGKPDEIPAAKARPLAFISELYWQHYANPESFITRANLDRILAAQADGAIGAQFLLDKKILNLEPASENYHWRGGHYVRNLADELAATLWLLASGEAATEAQFQDYVRRLTHADVWPVALQQYLPPAAVTHLGELAVARLLREEDLRDTGAEFTKIWFDQPGYGHVTITEEVPRVRYCHDSSWALLQSVEAYRWRFGEVLDREPSRQAYALLFRLVAACAPAQAGRLGPTVQLLKAADRPFVVRQAFRQLGSANAQAIPYLLTDPELMPMSFRALTRLTLDARLLPEQHQRDEQYRQICAFKARLCEELFSGALQCVATSGEELPEFGAALGYTLRDLAAQVFTSGAGSRGAIRQQAYQELYTKVLATLGGKRLDQVGYFSGYPDVPERLIDWCFAPMVRVISAEKPAVAHSDHLPLDLATLDLGAELLKLSYAPSLLGELAAPSPATLDARQKLVYYLRDVLRTYLTTTVLEVDQYDQAGTVVKPARSGSDYFGTEWVNWGYLYGQLYHWGLLQELVATFCSNLVLDQLSPRGKYEQANLLVTGKLRLLLKSLLLAYLTLHPEAAANAAEGPPVRELLRWLETTIEDIAAKYAHDELARNRLDIFNESLVASNFPAPGTTLISLLYQVINLSESATRRQFITNFFAQSVDIGRLLTAHNLLEAEVLRDIVARQLAQIEVADFIASRRTVTDLEVALIEAVNSPSHWQAAEVLLRRVQQHFRERKYHPKHADVLFEVELLLAFRLRDPVRLAAVPEPDPTHHVYGRHEEFALLKQFYLALDCLYNQRAYAAAIALLEPLLAATERDVRYAFHLYRAKTWLALTTAVYPAAPDAGRLVAAHRQWEKLLSQFSAQDQQAYASLLAAADSTSLPYLAHTQDNARFDQIVSRLPGSSLFEEELLGVVYDRYVARELPERAFHYLAEAERYYASQQLPPPALLDQLRQRQPDMVTIDRLRMLLSGLASQRAEIIPQLLPASLNGQTDLGQFVLHELIQAAQQLAEKIEGIRQITHENRLNDLLVAILSPRLAVWGWSLHDQSRVGQSVGGRDAGEADILLKAASKTIALVEALIRRDEAYTIRHLLKCQQYVPNLSRFYVVTYHLAARSNLEADWKAYKKTVQDTPYPADFALQSVDGPLDLSNELLNAEYLRVAQTRHGKNSVVFHLMLNLAVTNGAMSP